jgi:hypothetical protein
MTPSTDSIWTFAAAGNGARPFVLGASKTTTPMMMITPCQTGPGRTRAT